MNHNYLLLILLSIAMSSCGTQETSSESTQTAIALQPEGQLAFIREKYALIESNMASETYAVTNLVKEMEGISITYKRAMDGENIMYTYSSDCHDHGCNESSYYFWDNKLIFKFDQNSSWVGQSDVVSEKRTYYLNETAFLCLQKTNTGPGGYDAVNKQLSKMPNDTLQCNNIFDRSTIKEHLTFTNDVINELAIVRKVEDAGYPMFNVTFYFIDREEVETTYVNREGIMYAGSSLSALVGKTVRVSYSNKNDISVMAFYQDTDGQEEANPNWKLIKGIVKGAESVTTSDLPDQVTIEAADGSNIVFDYYIDTDMVSLNNKTVTAYYTTSKTKEVTALELVEDALTVDQQIIHASNDKFIVKVDRLSDQTIRYQSWSKPKQITDQPDLMLSNGRIEQQGTAGGYIYFFKNADWEYIVQDRWMSEDPDGEGIFLKLVHNNEEKLHAKLTDLKSVDTDQPETKGVKHYICYTNDKDANQIIWISFDADGRAIQIKYKGMESAISLVFDKQSENLNPGGPYPVFADYYNEFVDGKVSGVYKLTHSGNYDYAEYIREQDSKTSNFTIDHAANPYGDTPCF
jgi:hypothetical protein